MIKLRRIVKEAAELPGFRILAKPLYRLRFHRPYQDAALSFFGVYENHAQALAAAPPTLPTTFDTADSAKPHTSSMAETPLCEYPVVYWLSRLLAPGYRQLFDLGGQTGVSYFRFRRHLQYPAGMRWLVHDVPTVVAFGRAWATERDPDRHLEFTDSREDIDGSDVLLASGVLQYLDYTLPELLRGLKHSPPHVLVNETPMHPSRSFFTLQNIGRAICPYRVAAVPGFIAAMESLGYVMEDHWESFERQMHIPFAPDCSIESYHGFYFRRSLANPDAHPPS